MPAGVTVCNARGTRDVPVAEWVLAAILARTKELGAWQRQQERRAWQPRPLDELAGARVLIVGYGSIGHAVEKRLEPFEVSLGRVAGDTRPGVHGVADLSDLIGVFDIVVLLMPSTPETRRSVRSPSGAPTAPRGDRRGDRRQRAPARRAAA